MKSRTICWRWVRPTMTKIRLLNARHAVKETTVDSRNAAVSQGFLDRVSSVHRASAPGTLPRPHFHRGPRQLPKSTPDCPQEWRAAYGFASSNVWTGDKRAGAARAYLGSRPLLGRLRGGGHFDLRPAGDELPFEGIAMARLA